MMAMAPPNAEPGIFKFMNNLRFSLAMDPGRQLVENYIQIHGFKFLDDYLENVLAGPRRDGIVGVLKTPGRNRSKTMLRSSKPQNTVSLEDDPMDQEHIAPVNNFHRALLEAKDKDQRATIVAPNPRHQSVGRFSEKPHALSSHTEKSSSAAFTTIHNVDDQVDHPNSQPPVTDLEKPVLLPDTHSEQNLSVIAEGDETAEPSTKSTFKMKIDTSRMDYLETSEHQKTTHVNREDHQTTIPTAGNKQNTSSTSMCPSNPFNPQGDSAPSNIRKLDTFQGSLASATHWVQLADTSASESLPITQPVDNHTEPLPSIPHMYASNTIDAFTAPLPSKPSSASNTPTSPKPLACKPCIPQFPTLPAPMPLRKSMRAPREPLMSAGASTQVSSGGGPAKRTSWLMKAREAKAMDDGMKGSAGGATCVPRLTGGLKRKSEEMLGNMTADQDGGKHKIAKVLESEFVMDADDTKVIPQKETRVMSAQHHLSVRQSPPKQNVESTTYQSEDVNHGVRGTVPDEQEGILDRFKRTVEGLGARVGKSMGKSLGGGGAASALAEARAAAEARVVERERKEMIEETSPVIIAPEVQRSASPSRPMPPPVGSSGPSITRLSVSDLVSAFEIKDKAPTAPAGNNSTSTTPPNSPPAASHINSTLPPGPVFSKPAGPVFKPATAAEQARPKDLSYNIFSRPSPAVSVPLSSPNQTRPAPLSAQSTYESIASEKLFDADDAPSWMPRTQDTDYSTFVSESQPTSGPTVNDIDDDDSWPVGDRIATGPQWTFDRDESMTWSTLTESQTGPPTSESVPEGALNTGVNSTHVENADEKIGGMSLAGKSTVSLVDPKDDLLARTQSQLSMMSSLSSTQSNIGILGHATKFVSSVLGGSKKGKPEVKSLQLAAVVAKKQQEEKDKKATRMKEMENRRQLAIQRKVEEEKARVAEEERKIREDGERRKREREELTDKRPISRLGKKPDDDNTKKRKLNADAEKKPEVRTKPSSKEKPSLNTSATKLPTKSVHKQPTQVLASSAAFNATVSMASSSASVKVSMADTKAGKPPGIPASSVSIAVKEKGKSKAMPPDEAIAQPSHVVQKQMAARAKAQMQAARQHESAMSTENIELPDINSEYSASDDEDNSRTFDPPVWAQSPELRQALQEQSTVNPDDIFGAIRPLRMEEMFRTRHSRFRARSSSANWTGTDRLTVEEEQEYARRMGFR